VEEETNGEDENPSRKKNKLISDDAM